MVIDVLSYLWMLLLSLQEPNIWITVVNYGILLLAVAAVTVIVRSFIVTKRSRRVCYCGEGLDKHDHT